VGADRGVKSLIVAADADGYGYAHWEAVKALRHATDRLRRANQALSRTKKGSTGRVRAKARVARVHKQVADRRRYFAHRASYDLATTVAALCIEDLGIARLMRKGAGPEPGQPGRRTSTAGLPSRRSRGAGVPPENRDTRCKAPSEVNGPQGRPRRGAGLAAIRDLTGAGAAPARP
jgi:hypothetical protein